MFLHKNLIFIKIKFYSLYKIKFYFIREFILLNNKISLISSYLLLILFSKIKTIKNVYIFSNGSLGSQHDEERSKVR